ncbi:MAG: transcription termination/antitermination protein NusG [Deltaproteobacteria bacterium]|nr:transcription termination/antitermination protein NusG [Deltaproteobacteria bacterium]MBF0524762.1 transcription termination/antitermination protein NusG [Deltaproteobacteria bacterium]
MDSNLKWYIIHTYSGYENKVKSALEERIKQYHAEDKFETILVPTEKVMEMVKGEKKTTSRKFYPGYILIKMAMNDETWHIVKNTPKVTGFVGGKNQPASVPEEDAQRILGQMAEGTLRPKPKMQLEVGDNVRVVEGPFTNFNGVVDEVKPDKGKVRVLISIFGRSTPVELEFFQVAKI